ncbi:hypothetical protein IHE45_03G040500 [Dioscorea alata]|uniref:Uncharacterized protein n=1 Tax=Dioscorea alata TaxID=55571 RepID=A0ACB7WJT8_DIOAL|nr:hypothetical protein IHE45_03G040500 [Dioscorea alata]
MTSTALMFFPSAAILMFLLDSSIDLRLKPRQQPPHPSTFVRTGGMMHPSMFPETLVMTFSSINLHDSRHTAGTPPPIYAHTRMTLSINSSTNPHP